MKYLLILLTVLITANPVFAGDSCQNITFDGITVDFDEYINTVFLSDQEMLEYAQYYLLVGWYDFIPKMKEVVGAHSVEDLDQARIMMDCIVKKKNIKPKTFPKDTKKEETGKS